MPEASDPDFGPTPILHADPDFALGAPSDQDGESALLSKFPTAPLPTGRGSVVTGSDQGVGWVCETTVGATKNDLHGLALLGLAARRYSSSRIGAIS